MKELYENKKRNDPNPNIPSEDEEIISEATTKRHLKLRERAYRKFIFDFNNPSVPADKKARMFHESDQPFLIPQSLMFEDFGCVVYGHGLLMALRHFLHDNIWLAIFDFEDDFIVIKRRTHDGKYEELSRFPVQTIKLSLQIMQASGRSSPIIHAASSENYD